MSEAVRFVTTGDIVAHCALEGDARGPAIVFANSLGTDFRIWDPLLPELGSGLRSLRYDKRGHGLTGCTEAPYTMSGLAADLGALIDYFGLTDVIVCGVSVGGQIAQQLCADRPDAVRALILCDTAARIGDAAMWDQRIGALREGGVETIADGIMERWFGPAFRENRPAELAGWRNMLTRTPLEGYIGVCGALKTTDLTDAAAAISVPTLVVCGSDDGATPPDMVEAFAGTIPGARYAGIAGAGHLPSIEQPAALGAEIRAFLKENGLV